MKKLAKYVGMIIDSYFKKSLSQNIIFKEYVTNEGFTID